MGSSDIDTSNGTAAGSSVLAQHGARVLLVGTGSHAAVETSLTDLAAALIAQAGVPPENIRIMLNPTGATEFQNAVANIAAASAETLLIYYAGPGRVGPDGELQLATNGTEDLANPPPDTTVPCSRLLGMVRDHDVRTVVLILDCSIVSPTDVTLGPEMIPEPAPNECLLVSIAADQQDQLGPGTTHTSLAHALITLLQRGDPAEPPDLTLHAVYEHLSRAMPPTAGLRRYGDVTGDLVLARNPVYPVRRLGRRSRPRLILLALVCVLALLVAGGVLLWPRPSGGGESAEALSTKLAADAKALRATDPGLATQLAIAAYRDAPTEQAANQLYASLNTPLDGDVDNTGHAVQRVAAAADAPLVAATSQGLTLRIWNTANPAAPALDATIKAGGAVALAPHGNLLAAVCDADVDLCLWSLTDPHQPRIVAKLPRRPTDPGGPAQIIASIAISPDGSLLAAAAEQGFTLLWSIADPAHPRVLADLPNPTSDPRAIAAVAFAPHSGLLAETILRGTTRLWDITNPSTPTQVAMMGTGYAAVAFRPDGSQLAAVGDASVGLWNVDQPAAPRPITVTPIAGSAGVFDLSTVTFSADGSQLAFAGSDTSDITGELCTLDVYPANLKPGGTVATCTATGFSMFTMAATANGALFTGGWDGAVRLWRSALPRVNRAATTDDYTWATSPNGHLLAAPIAAPNLQPASSVGVWDISAPGGPSLAATLAAPAQMTTFLTSTTLLTATNAGTVQLWNLADARHPVQAAALGTATIPNSASGWPLPAAISADTSGDLVSVLDGAGVLHLWRITGSPNAIEIGSINPATSVTGPAGVLPDGRTAWLITSAGVDLWDISDLAHPAHRGASPFSKPGAIATATDRLAVGTTPDIRGGNATVGLFDLASGRPPSSTTVSSSVNGLANMSHDGRLLVAAGIGNNSMSLWDIRDPRQPRGLTTVSTLPGVREFAFDQAGNRLADWNNSTVEMWDIHDPTAPIKLATISLRVEGAKAPETIYSAGFTAQDGPLVVVVDGSILLFDVDPARLADRLCSYTGPAITFAQWQKYAPDVPYRKPCG